MLVPDSSRTRTRTRHCSIRFDQVHIRAYTQTIGDNPSVSYGPPISLDWTFEELPSEDLEVYETTRPSRRNLRQMMMNYYHRVNLLTWACGVSEQELKRAEKDANRIKRSRSLTKTLLPAQKLEEAWQSVGRKAKRWSHSSETKKKQMAETKQQLAETKQQPVAETKQQPVMAVETKQQPAVVSVDV